MEDLSDAFVNNYKAVVLGDEKVNTFPPHRDTQGITHIHVSDTGKEYELVNNEWKEKAPF